MTCNSFPGASLAVIGDTLLFTVEIGECPQLRRHRTGAVALVRIETRNAGFDQSAGGAAKAWPLGPALKILVRRPDCAAANCLGSMPEITTCRQ